MQFLQEDWAGGANQVARLRPPWKCGLIQMLLKQVLELDAGMLREPKKNHTVFLLVKVPIFSWTGVQLR